MRRSLILAALALGLWACSDTGGAALEVPVRVLGVGADGGTPTRFTNRLGWVVELDEAWLALGPVYFEESQDVGALAWLGRLSPIGTAHAHVIANAGKAVGEVLTQSVVDLLAPEPQALGPALGETGDCGVFEVQLRPPGSIRVTDPAALAHLAGANARIAGRATKGDVTIAFTGEITLDPADLALQAVTDIRPATPVPFVPTGGPLIRVRVADWLRHADFAALPEGPDPDAPRALTPDTAAHTAWLRAVLHRDTYLLEWLR